MFVGEYRKVQKRAVDGIRTHAGFPPADLESAALDRSATTACVTVSDMQGILM